MIEPQPRQGSARLTWKSDNPREVLQGIQDKHPNATKSELVKLMMQVQKRKKTVFERITEYFVANALSAEERANLPRKKTDYNKLVKTALSQMLLPSGKTVLKSTFGELANLNGKLAALSKMGKPEQIVGDVLSAEQIDKL